MYGLREKKLEPIKLCAVDERVAQTSIDARNRVCVKRYADNLWRGFLGNIENLLFFTKHDGVEAAALHLKIFRRLFAASDFNVVDGYDIGAEKSGEKILEYIRDNISLFTEEQAEALHGGFLIFEKQINELKHIRETLVNECNKRTMNDVFVYEEILKTCKKSKTK